MADLALKARPRTTLGKKVKVLRRQGVTPANIYGHNVESLAIEAETVDLALLLRRAGRTQLIQVTIDGEPSPRRVLVRQTARRATTDEILHVDFFEVSMREKLNVDVPLTLTGEAPVVDQFDAIVVQALESVSVECLPGDIPSNIEVDISTLVDTTSGIHIRDLVVPSGVEILNDPDLPVVSVTVRTAAAEEEEEAAAEEAAEVVAEAAAEETAAAEAAAEPEKEE
ncbi:MAG: 50S ribosomal protein L25, partial [Dehalococcoidia bacterium]